MRKTKEHCYKVETPSGKKYKEYLDKKQVKNLRIAEFKLKRC